MCIRDRSLAAPFASGISPIDLSPRDDLLDIHLFSKHLQFLDWKNAAEVAADIGFSGLDITVRPKGHVLPENVKRDLPKAISYVKAAGLSCKMITTAVNEASIQLDHDVIKTAADEGVEFYRSDWFKYHEELSLEDSLDVYKNKVTELGELNRQYDIIGCYQNHSGTKIGASVWEVRRILEDVNPEYFGVQYDIRHAVAEGGRSWPNGIKLLKDQIKVIVLKDFIWGEVNGKWKIVNVPLGEGMVDFTKYFRMLKDFDLKPPVSLHVEYPLGGAEKGRSSITIKEELVYKAMQKDLETAQALWAAA